MHIPRWIVISALAAALLVLGLFAANLFRTKVERPLARVQSWHYQLQKLDIDKLRTNPADLLVIDFYRGDGDGKPMRPLEIAEVEALKQKPGGGRRLVLAYLAIGEADESRYYWNPQWLAAPPSWHIAENCQHPRRHLVRYWEAAWKDIMIHGDGSYLGRIEAAGFDGVFLDRIDVHADIDDRFPEASARMISMVSELRREADRRRPGFLIVAQNAEELLESPTHRGSIDGLAKENFLFGLKGPGQRNSVSSIEWSRKWLDLVVRDGKPVFVTEYLSSRQDIAAARQELVTSGYVPAFPAQALDGGDPLVSNTPDPAAATAQDTKNCSGVWKKS